LARNVVYRCWSEGERELDLSAVLLLLDDRVNRRGKAAFLKHGLQGDAERAHARTHACMQFGRRLIWIISFHN
jgi:hypothetical protein